MTTLTGPRLPPRSGRAPRQLVVLLHGFGADGNDLIDLAHAWQPLLPDAAFVSPHAPEPCIQGFGRQWFSLTFRDPHERWRGVNRAAPTLDAFLDAELARAGLDESRLALVGFSQGCMMALHVGLRRPRRLAAVVGLSGMLVIEEGKGSESLGPESLKPAIRSVPPILLVHGDQDEVIPVEALFLSADLLAAAEVPVEWHLSAGTGHGIDEGALQHAGLFLASGFAGR
ncbi:phospholipase/Carboxylesterase [Methylobacterium sp. 4-46]|uniref:alpha/beta hydrolase n=1 Tax=unclassified Methylobacterium TaxID=2615210 RepID=UPI000152D065|nr:MULTISPECIES: alpha/beta fold hydrolase [Methylobacterium]ACA19208.1 phospholipase/Carboxylesterase [Methylobacterium sp. 4-46]WFT78416.1 alpha/beta fold hydrolase [Methylobacterium nodulans]